MLKISIITVTFNNIDTIEKTVRSVLDQNYLNLEYIVIDGGSTDGTLSILEKYKESFHYFQSSKDKGVFDAMNKGIKKSTGDLVGFVNGDDFLYENKISEVNEIFTRQYNKNFFSVADVDYIDKYDNIIGSKICRPTGQMLRRRFIEMPTNHLGLFVPLRAFKEIGIFDINFPYRADYLFILQLIKAGYFPIQIKGKIGGFRVGGQSGNYGSFFENYGIIKIVTGNVFLSIYSTLLSVSKLFAQRNFPRIYNLIVKINYKFFSEIPKKEILHSKRSSVIHLIDSDSGGGAEKLVFYLQKEIKFIEKVITFSKLSKENRIGSKYTSLNIKNKSPLSIIFASFFIFIKLIKMKNKNNIILHSHLTKSLYATFLPSIILGIPHIHTEHNTHNKRRSKWYIYPFENMIYNSLKYIICISEATRFELFTHIPSLKLNKVSVIENGTKLIKHKNRDFNKHRFNILILGSLTYKKGIDLFLSSIPSVVNRINKISIIGSGPEKKKLMSLSKKLKLDKVTEFIEYTSDIETYIYKADLGVTPSRWEGFGLVALEMRSSGLPILISDTPGIYNIFANYNGVFSFENGSKESLKKSLIKLLDMLSENKLNIKNLTNDFKKYNIESFINNYKIFYNTEDL